MNSIFFQRPSNTENDRNLLLIRSAIRCVESTGAKYTPKKIAKMLTTQPSDAESIGDEEMSGKEDVLLRDLKVEQVRCAANHK